MVLTWGTRAFCNKMLPCALDNDTVSLLQIKKQGLVDGASFLNTSVGNERFEASCIQNLLEVWSYLDGHPTERISWLIMALGFSRFSHSKKLPNSLPGHGPWKRVGWGLLRGRTFSKTWDSKLQIFSSHGEDFPMLCHVATFHIVFCSTIMTYCRCFVIGFVLWNTSESPILLVLGRFQSKPTVNHWQI